MCAGMLLRVFMFWISRRPLSRQFNNLGRQAGWKCSKWKNAGSVYASNGLAGACRGSLAVVVVGSFVAAPLELECKLSKRLLCFFSRPCVARAAAESFSLPYATAFLRLDSMLAIEMPALLHSLLSRVHGGSCGRSGHCTGAFLNCTLVGFALRRVCFFPLMIVVQDEW